MNLGHEIIERVLSNNNQEQIVFKGRAISGEEIVRNSLTLASSFRHLNFMQEQRVLLIMQDSPSFIYCFIALLSIGCIPVPLNPKMEGDVLKYILTDSRAIGVIVDANEYDRLEETFCSSSYIHSTTVIVDDTENGNTLKTDLANRLSSLKEKNYGEEKFNYYKSKAVSIAFWQYTSGTTGMPKAVQHSQEVMLLNTNRFAEAILGINKRDRIISIPKMFFGYGLGNSLFFPLLTGASVFLDNEWPSLERIQQNIKSFKPSIFFGVPKIYSLIIKNKNHSDRKDMEPIRLFFSAGAQLPSNMNKNWFSWTGKHIVNGIGCTEIGHVFICNKPDAVSPELSGWPVSDYTIRLVDLENQDVEVPVGKVGELCIKAPYELGRYWENQQVNDVKFQYGWYYSGDLCIKDEEGAYAFMGRKDNLFKINGRWVNPEEIEIKIMNLLDIEECALIDVEEEDGLSIPVLFLTKKAGSFISESEIKSVLMKHLSNYKIPKHIFYIEELPKNTNGKVSRSAIKVLYNKSYNNVVANSSGGQLI